MSSEIQRLRKVGFQEGISFLVLLGIAMPLKYLAGQPLAVKIFGWIHGVLFVLYGLALLAAMRKHGWSLMKGAFYMAAALFPCGPFLVDGRLKREGEALAAEGGAPEA